MFSTNEGKLDRVIRLIAGAALVYASYASAGAASVILGAAAALAVITGLTGFCGLYALMGVSTCRIDKP